MRSKQMVSRCLMLVCCICILFEFSISAFAEDPMMDAWVWNSESYRVMLYETPDLTNSSIYYHPYLLNGFQVRIQGGSDSGDSVCISFLEHTFWVDRKYVCMSLPENAKGYVFRSTTEDISLSSSSKDIIPSGTRIDVRGYLYDAVIICYNDEILEIHPASVQLREIATEAPEYLIPVADVIPLCKQELVNTYGLSESDIESMRIEFVSYSTLASPALYIIRFYTENEEIYTLHCNGEFGVIIYTNYSPQAVG